MYKHKITTRDEKDVRNDKPRGGEGAGKAVEGIHLGSEIRDAVGTRPCLFWAAQGSTGVSPE
jgi:hypothetical protein